MIAALLLLAASPEPAMPAQSAAGDGEPLLQEYSQAGADRMWGAHPYCSPPGHQQILRRVDARLARIRDALVARFGGASVAAAEARRQALFDEAFGGVGAGVVCRRNDRAMNREYRSSLQQHYDEVLRPLEAALRLRPN